MRTTRPQLSAVALAALSLGLALLSPAEASTGHHGGGDGGHKAPTGAAHVAHHPAHDSHDPHFRPAHHGTPHDSGGAAATDGDAETDAADGASGGDDADGEAELFCSDLCTAGLGAPRCGHSNSCRPPRLHNMSVAVLAETTGMSKNGATYGQPREELCPQLCPLQLGAPLCQCPGGAHGVSAASGSWRLDACDALCAAIGRVPRGCPACQVVPSVALRAQDIDWDWWCHILCAEGDGGLACLCDINP